MSRQPESRLTARILAYCRKRGGRWVKIQGSDESFQEVGIADIIGCYKGRAVAIEVKVGTNKLSRRQQRFLKDWHDAGGYICEARDLSDVELLLNAIDQEVSE